MAIYPQRYVDLNISVCICSDSLFDSLLGPDMSVESPKWTRPSDIMKVHLRRRSSLKAGSTTPKAAIVKPVKFQSPRSAKRKNPFGCSPKKRCNVLREQLNTECHDDATPNGGILFNVLDNNEKVGTCGVIVLRFSVPYWRLGFVDGKCLYLDIGHLNSSGIVLL